MAILDECSNSPLEQGMHYGRLVYYTLYYATCAAGRILIYNLIMEAFQPVWSIRLPLARCMLLCVGGKE